MEPRPWTYSQLDAYETCPKKLYETKIAKNYIEPEGEALKWGKTVHDAFEARVRDGTALPEGMQQWEGIAAKVASLPGKKLCEVKLAINKAFQPANYWKGCWSRGAADLLVLNNNTAAVLDYKTGRKKPTEQLDLYALYVFAHYPEVETVQTAYVWLKDRKVERKQVSREEVPVIWQQFLPRTAKLESAYERDSWPAKPSGLCKGWCPVSGCEHYRSRG
jgi:CRISPR/Cas system-associated exonuclease Cas4 (RecB family)